MIRTGCLYTHEESIVIAYSRRSIVRRLASTSKQIATFGYLQNKRTGPIQLNAYQHLKNVRIIAVVVE